MPKTKRKKQKLPATTLHSVKKKFRSKLPLRRPRTHFNAFLNLVNHDQRSPSYSASLLLRCDEPLISVDDDSSRVTNDDSLRRIVTESSADERYHKSYSKYAAVETVSVSESSSCVESCSVVGESFDAALNRKTSGISTLDRPVASEFDVTSQEQEQLPLFEVPYHSPALRPVEGDDDEVSIVDEGGLVSPIPMCLIDFHDSSSSEQEEDFSPSMYLDSGTDFSERSEGDTSPSLTYSLLLEFRRAYQRLTSPVTNDAPRQEVTACLRLEDNRDEEDCYLSLRSRERRQAYILDYTRQSPSLIKQRLQIVHWIIEQSAIKELQKETMFLGVNLFDRFLSNGSFSSKRNLQIVGIACLTLATRIEENQIYNSVQQSTFRMGCNTYSKFEVVAMEWLVQEVLNFKCFLPTIYNFLSFYLKVARADKEMAKNAQHLAELALLKPEQLSYWPSTVAASLVILSSLPSNQYLPHIRVMKAHLRSDGDNIDECIKILSLSLKKY